MRTGIVSGTMITIASVDTRNWGPFKGDQHLELSPTVFAIVARSREDAKRSSWLGKSRWAAGIDWGLFGRMPKECTLKRDLITRGEKDMKIDLRLSNRWRVLRTFGLASPERLTLFPPDARAEDALLDDEAQAKIESIIGLGKEDFLLAFIRQREMNRMVVQDAGSRMETVASWIRLAKVEAAAAEAEAVCGELSKRIQDKERRRDLSSGLMQAEFDRHARGGASELAAARAAKVAALELRGDELRGLRETWAKVHEREALAADSARYDALVGQGVQLSAQLKEGPKLAELVEDEAAAAAKIREFSSARDAVRRTINQRARVVTGWSDGVCPLAGKPCPAHEFVTRETRANAEQRAEDAAEDRRLTARVDEYEGMRVALADAITRRRRDEQRLLDLRDEVRRLKVTREKYGALVAIGVEHDPAKLAKAEEDYEQAKREQHVLERACVLVAEQRAIVQGLDAELVELEKARRLASVGAAIFGKGGAQRRIAEAVLSDIETYANEDVLALAGIDLSMKVVWSRETGALASACSSCGAPFATSRRVKQCERCGAERGAQLQNRLELVPSARSGAADDLAGFAFQLGASAWLRQDRLAGWGTVVLDEPIAQMDEALRKALSQHLPAILARAGYGQGFVIAHHASTLDALPGRILIESDGVHAVASVVA